MIVVIEACEAYYLSILCAPNNNINLQTDTEGLHKSYIPIINNIWLCIAKIYHSTVESIENVGWFSLFFILYIECYTHNCDINFLFLLTSKFDEFFNINIFPIVGFWDEFLSERRIMLALKIS